MFFIIDLYIVCIGVYEGSDGVVIIIGMGLCGFFCVVGYIINYGGYGFVFGDKGSGVWMGFEVIKNVLFDLDGLGEKIELIDVIC